MSKKVPFMVNARGRRRRAAAKKSPARRRNTAARSRSTTRKAKRRSSGVPAWVRAKGFSSWSSYMESIRPGGKGMARKRRRRSASTSRRRRRRNSPGVAVARANPRRRHARRRRNPVGFNLRQLPQVAMAGVVGAGQVIAGKGVARLVRGKMNLEGATTTGSLVEVGVGIVGAMVLRRRYPKFAEHFLIGAFIAPLETVAKQANIPYLSTALGDEGTLPLIGGEYMPALMGGEYMPAGVNMGSEEVPIQ